MHGCIMILFLTMAGCFQLFPAALPLLMSLCLRKVRNHETELEIHLDTGRHHQIRVQLASIGCPIVGDTKYNPELTGNKGWQTIRLCAYKLDFKHPVTHKAMHFQLEADPA